jgi:flagellar basal-body rod protein FlgB
MLRGLDSLFQLHGEALALHARRQRLLASNIANADTPNYHARDLDFATTLRALERGAASALVRTSARHLAGTPAAFSEPLYRVPLQRSLDGNTVELEVERTQFADNALRYEAHLVALNAQIRQLLAAIQG